MKKIICIMIVVLFLSGCTHEEVQYTLQNEAFNAQGEVVRSLLDGETAAFKVHLKEEASYIQFKMYEWKDEKWLCAKQTFQNFDVVNARIALNSNLQDKTLRISVQTEDKDARRRIRSSSMDQASILPNQNYEMESVMLSKVKDIVLEHEYMLYAFQLHSAYRSDKKPVVLGEDIWKHPENYMDENTKRLICVTVSFRNNWEKMK